MAYAFYETSFNDPTVKLVCLHIVIFQRSNRQTCLFTHRDHIRQKSEKKINHRSSNGTKHFDGYKRKIKI
ncbi:hypothetical protein ACE6H2_020088 [Prunus campanulata]